jgi:hypothetical protein
MMPAVLTNALSSTSVNHIPDETTCFHPVFYISDIIICIRNGIIMRSPKLNELLQYENPDVYKLYEQNYPKNKLAAKTAFQEMLKYLWLANQHEIDLAEKPHDPDLPPRCIMLRSMREIDEMWHEFILFTREYTEFCETYFGRYLHHLSNIFDTMPRSREDLINEIELLLPYIRRHLGDETLKIWFADYL